MKIFPVNSQKTNSNYKINNLGFEAKDKKTKEIEIIDGKEYVKVPKRSHDLDKLALGILGIILLCETIYGIAKMKKQTSYLDEYRAIIKKGV